MVTCAGLARDSLTLGRALSITFGLDPRDLRIGMEGEASAFPLHRSRSWPAFAPPDRTRLGLFPRRSAASSSAAAWTNAVSPTVRLGRFNLRVSRRSCGFPTRTYASSSSSWTPTRSFLEKSLALDSEVVALTIEDRERILWALTMSARTRWQSSGPFCSKSTSGACATGSCSSAAWLARGCELVQVRSGDHEHCKEVEGRYERQHGQDHVVRPGHRGRSQHIRRTYAPVGLPWWRWGHFSVSSAEGCSTWFQALACGDWYWRRPFPRASFSPGE